jgi:alpha-amylase
MRLDAANNPSWCLRRAASETSKKKSGCSNSPRLRKPSIRNTSSRSLEIAYKLEGLPRDFRQHLAVEFNFAGLPAQAAGRFFYDESRRDLGELGSRLDLEGPRVLGLVDDWLDIDARLSFAPASNGAATGIWTFRVSQSWSIP